MARPDTPLTRFRFWLAGRIDPYPDLGEGWCMKCVLNGGRTLVLSASGWEEHRRSHREDMPRHTVTIRARWPRCDPD